MQTGSARLRLAGLLRLVRPREDPSLRRLGSVPPEPTKAKHSVKFKMSRFKASPKVSSPHWTSVHRLAEEATRVARLAVIA